MADAVLGLLCGVCLAQPPRYRCPGCGARTCSASCIQKHKARADCSGTRAPTTFMPAARLRTAAGIDHDYNFISAIERARERYEKQLIDERGLITEEELRPLGPRRPGGGRSRRGAASGGDDEGRFTKVWDGDELHFIPTTADTVRTRPQQHQRGVAESRTDPAHDKHVRRRLRDLGIECLLMPNGMTRRAENKTAWNRRTSTINWQVEWLLHGHPMTPPREFVRVLSRTLDGTPLNTGLASSPYWKQIWSDPQGQAQEKEAVNDCDKDDDDGERPRKRRKVMSEARKALRPGLGMGLQDAVSTTWSPTTLTMQDSITGQWNQTWCGASVFRTADEHADELARWQFFLVRPTGSARKAREILPLEGTTCLADALRGRTVIEFPTILLLPPAADIPPGYALGSAERREQAVGETGGNSGGGHQDRALSPGSGVQVMRERRGGRERKDGRGGRGGRDGREKGGRRGGRGVRGGKEDGWNAYSARGGRPSTRAPRGGMQRRVLPAPEPSRAALPLPPQDADEGEINSDGEEMDGADAGGRVWSGRSNSPPTRASSPGSLHNAGDSEDGVPQKGSGKATTGLVDYGSSGDSD